MRVSIIACALLAVSTPAFAGGDGIVVSKKVTTLETTDKALTKIKLVTLVPGVLMCFSVPAEVDVDIDSDGTKINITTDRGDLARATCLEDRFRTMKVKTKSAFKARIHLTAKVDPRQKKKDDDARTKAIIDSVTANPAVLSKLSGVSTGTGTGTGTGVGSQPAGGKSPPPGLNVDDGDFKTNKATGSNPSQRVGFAAASGDLGDYSAEEIDRVIKAHAGVLRACYQKQLTKEPKLAGKLTYEIKIDTAGAVSRVMLKSSTAKSTALDDCLKIQIMRFKFPAKSNAAVVVYPLIFTQG